MHPKPQNFQQAFTLPLLHNLNVIIEAGESDIYRIQRSINAEKDNQITLKHEVLNLQNLDPKPEIVEKMVLKLSSFVDPDPLSLNQVTQAQERVDEEEFHLNRLEAIMQIISTTYEKVEDLVPLNKPRT